MKLKFLAVCMALAMALSLSACGGTAGGNSNAANPPSTAARNSAAASDTNSGGSPSQGTSAADLTTVAGFLAYYGLSEDDLKCANFTRLDKTVYDIDTGDIEEVSAYVSQKLTDDQIRAWLEQVMAKLNSLSDNGKVELTFSDGEALTVDYMMGQPMNIGQGTYPYKGKTIDVLISVTNGLDSDDPNDATACCSLQLEVEQD